MRSRILWTFQIDLPSVNDKLLLCRSFVISVHSDNFGLKTKYVFVERLTLKHDEIKHCINDVRVEISIGITKSKTDHDHSD